MFVFRETGPENGATMAPKKVTQRKTVCGRRNLRGLSAPFC